MSAEKANAWINRVFCPITLLIILGILIKEVKKQQNVSKILLPLSLRICSITAISLCIFYEMFKFLMTIKSVCLSIHYFITIIWCCSHIFFILFQLHRLKFCFSSNDNNAKYGYSNYIFILMHIIAFILFAATLFLSSVQISKLRNDSNNGCRWHLRKPHYIMGAMMLILYFLWDWTVLCLYGFKLYQCIKLTKTMTSEQKISQQAKDSILYRIKLILSKLLFLSIWNEILTLITFLMIILGDLHETIDLMQEIIQHVDMIGIAYIMTLMMEHNNHKYQQFMQCLAKYHCICCFKDLLTENHNKENNTTVIENRNSIDTKTLHPVEMKMQIYRQESEFSVEFA